MTFENLRLVASFLSSLSLLCALPACTTTVKNGTTPKDGGIGVFVDEDASAPVGDPCGTDMDCTQPATCSSDTFANGPYFPTPVCVSSCTPSSQPDEILVCGDGTGVCQASSVSAGTCFPVCFVTPDGQSSGCLLNDVCQVIGSTADPDNPDQTDLFGECQPGCTADSQCPSSSHCDPTYGSCDTTVTPPSLPFGAACDPSSSANPPPCACVGASGSTTGFCTAYCTTGNACPQPGAASEDGGAVEAGANDGGATDAGPTGAGASLPFVCSAQLGSLATIDAGIAFTTQPVGLQGLCFQACNTKADCAFLGSGATCTPDPASAPATGICISP
jgi:hypothetical protein